MDIKPRHAARIAPRMFCHLCGGIKVIAAVWTRPFPVICTLCPYSEIKTNCYHTHSFSFSKVSCIKWIFNETPEIDILGVATSE